MRDLAAKIAFEAHHSIGQLRKYTNEPYFNHCERVAYLVSTVSDDEEVIAAAYLHDVLEDVCPKNPNYDENFIRFNFGGNVFKMVWELTDQYKVGSRKIRKRAEAERLGDISADSQTIKYADLIDNTSSICRYDKEFANIYMEEKAYLLDVMTDGNDSLREICLSILFRWRLKNEKV